MPSRDPRELFSMEETMRTLRPPMRRRSELLSWIAAALIATPLAFLIVGGVFAAHENMASGETRAASASARAHLAAAQRGDPTSYDPAAQQLAVAATPSFLDRAADAVYQTLCPLFGSCNIAENPSTNHATSRSNVTSAELIPRRPPPGGPAETSVAASSVSASRFPIAGNAAMPAAASYSETNTENVKSPDFIPLSPSPDGLTATSVAVSYASPYSASPESADGSLDRPTPQPLAVSTPSDTRSLAILGLALQKLFDQKLTALDQSLRQVILQNVSAPLSLPASGGVVNNIALSQRVDNLSGTTIQNPTITGGSITASSISGTLTNAINTALAAVESLTTTELVATNATTTSLFVKSSISSPNATIGALTATSTLAVSGTLSLPSIPSALLATDGTGTVEATSSPTVAYFTATSTATSTFTGGASLLRLSASATSTLSGLVVDGNGLRLSALDCTSYANGGTLTTDAFGNIVCAADDGGAGSSVAGSNAQVQFNDSGSFGGDGGFTYNKTADRATLVNASTTNVTATYASSSSAFFGVLTLPTLSSGALAVDAYGIVYSGATSTLSTISGTLALNQVANIAANTILGNATGASGNVAAISTSSLGILTTNVAEGSNLYFTAARADARINATSSIGTLTSAPNLGTVATSLTGLLKATAGVLSTALIDLASDITGTLGVSHGGTGWANIAAGAIPYGNGAGALATTSAGTAGTVLALLGGIPTWTATTTFSSPLAYSNGAVSIPAANGSTNGYLSSSDWTTFNGKLASVTADAPLSGSGTSGSHLTLDTSGTWSGNAGTATKLATARAINGVSFDGTANITITAASSTALADHNTWTNAQTFSAAPILSTLSGLLKGNGASALTAAAAGTDYAPATAGTSILLGNGSGGFSSYGGTSCTNQFLRSVNGAGVATCASVSLTADVTGTLAYANGGTGTTTAPSSWLLYGGGNGVYQAVSTTSLTASGVLSLSNPISVIGAAASALTLTGGSNGQTLAWNGGAPAWVATTTFSATEPIAATQNGNTWSFTWSPSATAATSIPYASTTAISSTGGAWFATDGGNIGIGTTTPSQQLTLTGAIELPMSGGSTQGVVYKKGYSYQSEGASQAFVNQRFIHDYRPLTPFPTDGANTFVGSLAGNFTMAPDAGAIGNYSIQTAYNAGFGTQALTSLTTGYNNAALGVNALRYNTQGYSNTAVGRDASHQNTVGIYNVSIGQSAAYSNTTGSYNIAIGGKALDTNDGGTQNIAIGYQAGFDQTLADNNVFLGQNTGRGITTGSNNTILGANVTSLSATLANNIIIADGSGNRRINVDSSGNVGIGTTTPDASLNITGAGQTTSALDTSFGAALGGALVLSDSGNATNNGGAVIFGARSGLSSKRFAAIKGLLTSGSNNGAGDLAFSTRNASADATLTERIRITATGNVGIATTSPWRTLGVTGTVGFDGLTAGAGAGSLCLSANKEVTYSNGAGCTGSSQRFKHDILSLNASTSLDTVLKLNPVSFVYNDDIGVKGPQVGLIAEQVQQIDPRLVATDASSTPFTVKYENLTAILAGAIQKLFAQLSDLANTVASFAERVVTKELVAENVTADNLTFKVANGQKLCLGATCVTETQLAALLSQSAAAGFANPSPAPTDTQFANASPEPAEPPTIEIQGNNPAHLNVGDTYNDLGARITGPTQADTNLGIKTFLNGALVSNIVLDTSLPATDTIDYVATNAAGTSTSTRTIIIAAPQEQTPPLSSPTPVATTTATSTPAQ